ncbi:hypothetical protein HMPREF6485_0563 [Segatella buccae ATCC 33574]|uniref:Uncharacterized protein n=1 Tax=Segatella buccae ATCC 33574 TaxID=873513 RepID=E6K4M9_9BACT|nr:hypothetical protein HMPREF6485_0563 [Segatella buccae ATCC 33574]
MRLSFGPSELPSVALLQYRFGRMRKSMGQIGWIRRMGLEGEMGVGKICVRLFRNF